LLDRLWEHRQYNERFGCFSQHPWERPPRPAFGDIRLIETERMTAEEKRFIDELCQQFVDHLSGSYVRLKPDDLVGWIDRSWKSRWSGRPDAYCIMPLGHMTAEVSAVRTAGGGRVLLQSTPSLGGVGRGYGRTRQDQLSALKCRSRQLWE